MTWHSSSLLFMFFWIFIHTYPFISHIFPTVLILPNLLHLSLSVNKLPFFPLPTLLTNWPNINSSNSLCYFFKIPTCLHPFITNMIEIGILSCCCNHSAIWLIAQTIHSPRVRSMWFSSGIWLPRIWEYSFLSSNTAAFHMYPFSWSIYSLANIIDICVHILFLPIGLEALWMW